MGTMRPGRFGEPPRPKRNKESRAGKGVNPPRKKVNFSEKTIAAVANEILAAYKVNGNWSVLEPQYQRSRSGIATGLIRNGKVTTIKDYARLGQILEFLEASGKVALPAKTTSGGNHRKPKQ